MADNNYRVSGTVRNIGSLTPRTQATVLLLDHATGEVITRSSVDGSTAGFLFTEQTPALKDVVAYDGVYNAKILSHIQPKGMLGFNDFGLGSGLVGTAKWKGIAAAPNGKLYCAPFHNENILIIDPVANTASLSKLGAFIDEANMWDGIALASDGKLYCAPSNSSTILIINPTAGTATQSSMSTTWPVTDPQWSGIAAGADGNLYCAPYYSNYILKIVPGGSATQINFGADLSGVAKWSGIALADNGKLYCVPYDAPDILVIDPSSNSATRTTMGATGLGFYRGVVKGGNGKLYGIPQSNSDGVLIIDPVANTATISNMGTTFFTATGNKSFCGGALSGSKIYAPPSKLTNNEDTPRGILIINTSSDSAKITEYNLDFQGYGGSQGGTDLWNGAAVGADGKIYCAPFNADKILVIGGLAPFAFYFQDKIDQTVGDTITSDPVTLKGIFGTFNISVTGGAGAKYSINGGAFTASPGTVVNNDVIRAQVVAPGSAVVTIDTFSDSFDTAAPNDLPQFMVVNKIGANTGINCIMTSNDGVTWTNGNLPAPPTGNGWSGPLAYGSGQYVMTCTGNTSVSAAFLSSPDGVTWTQHSGPAVGLGWPGLVYGNGTFVAVCGNGSQRVATSNDGLTWTGRTVDLQTWYGVVWAPIAGKFVVVAPGLSGALAELMTSPNGNTWTRQTAIADPGGMPNGMSALAANGSIIVSFSSSIVSTKFLTSVDGINWTARNLPVTCGMYNVTWSTGLKMFLAVGLNSSASSNICLTSADGITWTSNTMTGLSSVMNPGTVIWNSKLGLFVLLTPADTTHSVATSSNGISWTERTTPTALNTGPFSII